jgi:hypothetical protein
MPLTRVLHKGLPKRKTLAWQSSWGVSPARFRAAPTFQPARCIRRPLNAPQPHIRRTYVPRHHDAGVVHPQPNEPHDPEEPVPVDQPHVAEPTSLGTTMPEWCTLSLTNHTTQKNQSPWTSLTPAESTSLGTTMPEWYTLSLTNQGPRRTRARGPAPRPPNLRPSAPRCRSGTPSA